MTATLESLSQRMQEYVKMEDELAFDIFVAYYQDLITFLQAEYQNLNTEQLIETEAICNIVAANAQSRALSKNDQRKKFQKMAEKGAFWQKAIHANLKKQGFSDEELQEKVEGLWE